jgi:hypothetical protein
MQKLSIISIASRVGWVTLVTQHLPQYVGLWLLPNLTYLLSGTM